MYLRMDCNGSFPRSCFTEPLSLISSSQSFFIDAAARIRYYGSYEIQKSGETQ